MWTGERTLGGYPRCDLARLRPEQFHRWHSPRKTEAYVRVSSHGQKDDVERQKPVLARYCARQGWTFAVVADLGVGMNCQKKGLKRLLNDILADRTGRLVVDLHGSMIALGSRAGVRYV